MIRTFTKILALALLASTTFIACKKDKEESLAVTKENLVGTYQLTSFKVKTSMTTGEHDGMEDWEACEKDDLTILKSDGTVEYQDAGTACDPKNDGTSTWSVANSKVTIDGSEYTVKSLTNKNLVVEEAYSWSGISYTGTMTFTRK